MAIEIGSSTGLHSPWVAPAMGNGWANYETSFRRAAYCRSGDNRVQLRGLVKHPTTATPTGAIYKLPYGPSEEETFYTGGVYATVGLTLTRVDILPSGEVVIYGDGVHVMEFLTLAGINFYAD